MAERSGEPGLDRGDERRQRLDLRRSGAVEAIAGKAEPGELAPAMGNTLAASTVEF